MSELRNLPKQTIVVGGIWLRKSMDQLEVLAEVDGEWRVVIADVIHGMSEPISHIVEPLGIAQAKVPAWLTEPIPDAGHGRAG